MLDLCCWDFAHMSWLGDFYDDVYWSYDMYILEMYDFYPLRLLRNFIYACYLNLMWRRAVYFLNIYIIRVYYRFNRNRALHLSFSLFSLVQNNRERKMKRENKNVMWVWERKLSKSCNKVVVQISFLFSYFVF